MKKTDFLNHLYPIFWALYPLLALRQANITYVNMTVTIRSLGLTLFAVVLIWLLLRLLLKDWHKAGILTSLGAILFFSYGHVFLWALEASFGPLRHRTLGLLSVLIFVVVAYFVIRRKDNLGLARFLNITSTMLMGLILIQSLVYAYQVWQTSSEVSKNRDEIVVSESGGALPDVYLIILDAHTRSDVLLEHYDYDNREFISSLEEMGFYVAECSQSNYPGTNFSIISMMNMNYFYNLFDEVQVLPALKRSTVSETLRGLGYTVVAFENRASGHFDLLEDVHLSRNITVLENVDLGGGINEFESMLIETSLLRIFVDMPQLLPGFISGDIKNDEYYEHYLQTHFILEKLKELPTMPGPKFVMAHILVPHDPYIFAPNGSYKPSGAKGPTVGYRNNIMFIDNFLPDTLEAIINQSETPPIIIIQGDHGPSGEEVTRESRMSILNAYYLGDYTTKDLYPSITPVNSFRVIFNAIFGTEYKLLEDHSYYLWNRKEEMLSQENEVVNLCQP